MSHDNYFARPTPRAARKRGARLVLLAATLLVLLPVVVKEIPREWARWYYAAALENVEHNKAQEALKNLATAIDLDPDQIAYPVEQASIYFRLKQHDKAFEQLALIAEGAPPDQRVVVYQAHAELLLNLHRWQEAVDVLENARPLIDDLPEGVLSAVLNHLAYLHGLANSELDVALRDIHQAFELLPDSDSAVSQRAMYLDTRGYVRYRRREYEKARDDLNEAIKLFEPLYFERLQGLIDERNSRIDRSNTDTMIRSLKRTFATILYHRLLVNVVDVQGGASIKVAVQDAGRIRELGFLPTADLY